MLQSPFSGDVVKGGLDGQNLSQMSFSEPPSFVGNALHSQTVVRLSRQEGTLPQKFSRSCCTIEPSQEPFDEQ